MRIGISQREESIGRSGHIHDCLCQNWYGLLRNHEIVPIPNAAKTLDFNFDMLILSSGNSSPARLKTERAAFSYAIDNNIPVLGTCHGAFVIADIIGATIKSVEDHVGREHIVKLDGRNVIVNSFHEKTITALPSDYEIIATDLENNIEGFKHSSLPIYGILWHPEKQEVAMLPDHIDGLLEINKDIFSQNFDWIDNI